MAKETYRERYFNNIDEKLHELASSTRRMEKKLDKNTEVSEKALDEATKAHNQARRTNGRVDKLEQEVFNRTPVKVSELPDLWKDPTVIRWVLIIIAILAAGWYSIDISGVLKP